MFTAHNAVTRSCCTFLLFASRQFLINHDMLATPKIYLEVARGIAAASAQQGHGMRSVRRGLVDSVTVSERLQHCCQNLPNSHLLLLPAICRLSLTDTKNSDRNA